MKKSIFLSFLLLSVISGIRAAQLSQQKSANGFYFVSDYGTKGDGITKDTKAVQKAIDACSENGGGTVYFPAGTYLCGSLHLKSNIELHLEPGSVIKMSDDNHDFDPYETLDFKNAADKETSFFHFALICGENVENISITGKGTIDGNRVKRGGPKPIALKLCQHVKISDITLKNAPNYNISMIGTDFVNISGVTILNGFADGIDPDGCQNVIISDCSIDCFDDAIVPKASFSLGYLRAVENLTVTNCILSSNCNAFKFGTETGGNFKNVTFSNSTIYLRKTGKNDGGSGIAIESVDGAEIEGVTISNISIRGINSPIFIRLGNRGRDMATPKPGFLRDVIISNIVVEKAIQPCMILGIPGYPVENVTLSNLKISFIGGGSWEGDISKFPENEAGYPDADMFGDVLPAYGFYCRHIKNLQLQNIFLTLISPDKRPALIADDAEHLNISTFRASGSSSSAPVIHLNQVRQSSLRDCQVPENAGTYLKLTSIENPEKEVKIYP